MRWKKLCKVFEPIGDSTWMKSYAAVPVADLVREDVYKVYFSARDDGNRSHTGYICFDLNNPKSIMEISKDPVIQPGPVGAFDDSGAMATCIANVGSKKYLYYIGWNLGVTVPFRNSIGLAVSDDGGRSFKKISTGPIIDRNTIDHFFVASNCVLIDNGVFRMWYLSCVKWDVVDGKPRHHYHIRYAESPDGINWQRSGKIAIDFKDDAEYAISVPRVMKDSDKYRMWYSARGSAYRIGYAESSDGYVWTRQDEEAGIDPSASGWDSEMLCYPCIFDHKGRRYMVYNGNEYGRTGFGLAVLES